MTLNSFLELVPREDLYLLLSFFYFHADLVLENI